MNRDEKREVVERLVTQIKESKALIVTDYRGLTVTQTAELRRTLREAGASFHIAKNTLARLAAEQAERPTLIEFLEGPTAIAFIEDDPAATAKRLSEVARTTRILAVKGGVMNGHTLSADQIRELGDLPPRPTLLSQVVGAIAGPAQSMVGVLNAPLRDIVAVLDAYIQKRQEAEGAEAPAAEPEAASEPEAAAESPEAEADAKADEDEPAETPAE
jgi:large subunit ribosomal protein L10